MGIGSPRVARSDAEEEAQIAEAIRLSLAPAEPEAEFELVDLPSASSAGPSSATAASSSSRGAAPTAAPKAAAAAAKAAAAKLSARPVRRRTQPRVWYAVTSVRAGAESSLGLHLGTWDQLQVPGGRLAGSGWNCRRADDQAGALAHWVAARGEEEAPIHIHP